MAAAIKSLQDEVRSLRESALSLSQPNEIVLTPQTTFNENGGIYKLGNFFEGSLNESGVGDVPRICLAAGRAEAIDQTGNRGIIGLAKGENGKMLSEYDT